MKYRGFGKTGIKVSEIGIGTWSMGSLWGDRDDAQALKTLNEAIDSGINFWDTAYAYGEGHSEELIGKVLKERKYRDKIYVATKIPPKDHHWPAKHSSHAKDIFPSAHIREMTETSLKNLKSDYIDIQQLHVWGKDWLGQGDWLQELKKLQKEGKVRWFGISINDHEPDTALDVVKSGEIDSVQVIYNIFDQTPEKNLLHLCKEHGVGVIVRVPLDEGGLSGKLTPETKFAKNDWRRFYFKGDRLRETCERAERLKDFLNEETRTIPDLALKFCLSHPAVSTVIPGMRRPEHVRPNTRVSDLSPLPSEVLEELKNHAWPRNFYPRWEEEGV
ncbi:MAG: aldo/keto reductase [Deltaproteobacteria bacterium]|nr:aldo/keto reductase [Deltaproteobacteria bacterium]